MVCSGRLLAHCFKGLENLTLPVVLGRKLAEPDVAQSLTLTSRHSYVGVRYTAVSLRAVLVDNVSDLI
jgi:hypothetical protein